MIAGRRAFIFGITIVTLFLATHTYAQSLFTDSIFGAGSDLAITMTPTHPAPGDSVHLSAKSTTLDLSSASLTWRLNGKVLKSAANTTDIDVPAGDLGSETDVTLSATSPDNGSGTAQTAIIPTEIDLLYDAASFVPPFYQGRALPSAGTSLHLQAIVHFKRSNGTLVRAADITYTWKRNGTVIGSVSGRGKSAATISAPFLYGTDTISVDAVSSDSKFTGYASTQIQSVEPVLVLYQDHPLFGIMYYNALGMQTSIPDTEMSFAAIPYFAQVASANDSHLIYDWTVNGSAITADTKNPSEITIDASKSDGNATINLEATHSSNYFMDSKGSWALSFSNASSFTTKITTAIKDVFHSGQ